MIGFSDSKFLKEYIKPQKDKKTGLIKDKLEDNFQTGKQKLLPFTLNPTSGCVYDGTCGLNGVAGEFYRIKTQSTATPIYSPQDTEETLRKELGSNSICLLMTLSALLRSLTMLCLKTRHIML